jgi:hypothetical protein
MSPQSDRGKSGRELHDNEKSMSRWTMWVAVFGARLKSEAPLSAAHSRFRKPARDRALISTRCQFSPRRPSALPTATYSRLGCR